MATLRNHPGFWLRDAAAQSFDRMEAAYGAPFSISSAGRSVAEQQELINAWNRGGPRNRPPYLYQPAMPATASPHVMNGGEAVDVTNPAHRAWIAANGRRFGWRFTIPSDIVHMVYFATEDRSAFAGGNATPIPKPEPDKEIIMPTNGTLMQHRLGKDTGWYHVRELGLDFITNPTEIATLGLMQTPPDLPSGEWRKYVPVIDGAVGMNLLLASINRNRADHGLPPLK